ncbi:hypothetical protein IFT77_13850 [Frigoribacterium sp. CFBP 13729]|uniref:hypothetical protein n=1 Tax=Frigoribacterium sp. CFBP 13729 TaxID=2775293 RepID=UPI00177D2B7F|nr:hypothetical protein [Frigoribacterium sp. CFBP 13729]MBD8611568.1 hypothetical protein [Frigoribacterium sp. CFBP 13729]
MDDVQEIEVHDRAHLSRPQQLPVACLHLSEGLSGRTSGEHPPVDELLHAVELEQGAVVGQVHVASPREPAVHRDDLLEDGCLDAEFVQRDPGQGLAAVLGPRRRELDHACCRAPPSTVTGADRGEQVGSDPGEPFVDVGPGIVPTAKDDAPEDRVGTEDGVSERRALGHVDDGAQERRRRNARDVDHVAGGELARTHVDETSAAGLGAERIDELHDLAEHAVDARQVVDGDG